MSKDNMHLHVDNLIIRRGNTRLTNHIFTINYTNRTYGVNINGDDAVYITPDIEECTLNDLIYTCKRVRSYKKCMILSSVYMEAQPDDYDLFVLLAYELIKSGIDIDDVVMFDSYHLRNFKTSDGIVKDSVDQYELLEAKFYTLIVFSTARLWGGNVKEKAIRTLVEIANHYIYSNADVIMSEIDRERKLNLPLFMEKTKKDNEGLAEIIKGEALIDDPDMLNLAATILKQACGSNKSKREKIGDKYITNAYIQILNAYRALLDTSVMRILCDFTNDKLYNIITDSTFNAMFMGIRGCICLLDRDAINRNEIYSRLYRLYSRHVYVGQLELGVAYVVTNDDTVDIVMEALREFGIGNVSEEKYKMPLLF